MGSFERQMRRRREWETKQRRVLLQRQRGIDDFGSRSAESDAGSFEAWRRDWARGHFSPVKTHPVARLTSDGVDYGHEPKPGDEVAYGMDPYRTDDCLQAAIATVTQVPIEDVPELALDKRLDRGEDPDEISRSTWERIDRWAAERGLALKFFGSDDLPVPRRRWIGVIMSSNTDTGAALVLEYGRLVRRDRGEGKALNDHCLVMSHDRLVFDPSCSVKAPPGMAMLRCDPTQITYGISFDKEE